MSWMPRSFRLLLIALLLGVAGPAGAEQAIETTRGAAARRPAPDAPVRGRIVNADRKDRTLELVCGPHRWRSAIRAGETVLIGEPAAVGCSLRIAGQAESSAYAFETSTVELRVKDGNVLETVRTLPWSPVREVYGDDGPWPKDAVRQWPEAAEASSEYSRDGWSAARAAGAPDTDICGDIETAWATKEARSDRPEWIVLRYPSRVRAVGARLYVTNAPGAVREVQARTGSGWETVWKGPDPTETCPAVLAVRFREEVDTETLRVVLDTSSQTTWFELDSVELIGTKPAP